MTDPFEVIADSLDRERWLELRRGGIGGSDAPAILGLVPWASPSSVQADKWGLLDEPDDAELLRWGRRLEPAIIAGLAEDTGHDLRPYGMLLRSTRWPFMLCTPDAVTRSHTGVFAQIKNTVKAGDWSEAVPEYVWVQCQHELAVTGRPRMIAAALILGNRCRWSWVERDDAFIEDTLVPAERDFWRATSDHEPVPPDASEHTTRALQALYPDDSGETVALDGHFLDLDAERLGLLEQKKAAESRLREIDNEIRGAMKTASVGVLPNGVRFSLKTTHRKGYEVQPTTYRALRRLKAKESA